MHRIMDGNGDHREAVLVSPTSPSASSMSCYQLHHSRVKKLLNWSETRPFSGHLTFEFAINFT